MPSSTGNLVFHKTLFGWKARASVCPWQQFINHECRSTLPRNRKRSLVQQTPKPAKSRANTEQRETAPWPGLCWSCVLQSPGWFSKLQWGNCHITNAKVAGLPSSPLLYPVDIPFVASLPKVIHITKAGIRLWHLHISPLLKISFFFFFFFPVVNLSRLNSTEAERMLLSTYSN